MRSFITLIALLVCATGFSNNEDWNLHSSKDSKIFELIESELNVEKTIPSTVSYEIVDIKYDEVAPCTLRVKVTAKLIVDGVAMGDVTVEGELTLQNCSDIADIGVGFVKGLVEEAINKVMALIK